MKLAHIINPFDAPKGSEHSIHQAITLKTMRDARWFTKRVCRRSRIDHYAVTYPEDVHIVPEGFNLLPSLDRSIMDLKPSLTPARRLPIFKDMLDRLYKASDADYFIQTNIDIGLMPHFYQTIIHIIEKGHDCFCVNKRLIPKFYHSIDEIPEMYAEPGTLHNGYDCFVFPRDLYPSFVLGNICMGIPWSETALAVSMVAHGANMTVFKNMHITFHIGDSRTWLDQHAFRQHNSEEFAKALTTLMCFENKRNQRIEKHEITQWLIYKLKHELQPYYSKECHELCARTVGVR